MNGRPLTDVARVIRSKNSSPFELTLDIVFRHKADFQAARDADFLTRESLAALYRCPLEHVGEVIYYEPALAVKATIRRLVPSGSFGDSDVYGAQQHGPLLAGITVPAPDACPPG